MIFVPKNEYSVPRNLRIKSIFRHSIVRSFLFLTLAAEIFFVIFFPLNVFLKIKVFFIVLNFCYFLFIYKRGFVFYKTKQNIEYEFYGLEYYVPKEIIEEYIDNGLKRWIRVSIRRKLSIKKLLSAVKPPIVVRVLSQGQFSSSNPFTRVTKIPGQSIFNDEVHMHQINLQISYLLYRHIRVKDKNL